MSYNTDVYKFENSTSIPINETEANAEMKRSKTEPFPYESEFSEKQYQSEPAPLTRTRSKMKESENQRESDRSNQSEIDAQLAEQSEKESMGTRLEAGAKAVAEKAAEIIHEARVEFNKETPQPTYESEKQEANIAAAYCELELNRAMDSGQPLATRLEAGVKAIGEKASELFHEAKAEIYKDSSQPTSLREKSANSQTEEKNSSVPVTTRIEAGVSAIGDKVAEKVREIKAEIQKQTTTA